MLVVDGVIEAVGPMKASAVKKKARGAKVLDARGKVIMPGFINTHMHLYSTFARGLMPKRRPPRRSWRFSSACGGRWTRP